MGTDEWSGSHKWFKKLTGTLESKVGLINEIDVHSLKVIENTKRA